MNAKHLRLPITARTNKKKRAGFRFFSSNQTFYLTFFLSILFHIGILYSIPPVNLFSNGTNAEQEKMIVLDLLDVDALPSDDDLALSEEQEHQFQAVVPDIPWDWSEDARRDDAANATDTDDPEFAAAPNIAELKEDYTLVSDIPDQPPDLQEMLVPKREPEELLSRTFRPKQPELDKPNAEQLRSEPVEQSEENTEEQPARNPLQEAPQLAGQDNPEESFTFPRRVPDLEERQAPRLAEKKLARPSIEKQERQVAPRIAAIRPESPTLQDQRLGLARENEDDKNRFGIFAGERFEAPELQEPQPSPETDKQEADKENDVTQEAETLQTESAIEGPIRGRAIVYRPRPPQIGSFSNDVELRLRFWVLPDGTIGEVIPMKRGNAQLEQIAIDYLKKWQFEPLPSDAPQKEIWGTIPIKFTAQ